MSLFARALQWLGLRKAGRDPEGRQLDEVLSALAEPDPQRVKLYKLYRDYYDGHQGTKLPQRVKAFLQLRGLQWSENFCEPIVDILAERLHVSSFSQKGPESEQNQALQEWLTAMWEGDAAGTLQATVHTNVPMLGDGIVAVDWDPVAGRPAAYWNDPSICNPIYDTNGNLVLVTKTWTESSVTPTNPTGQLIRRLNLHFPDRIEKWFTLSSDSKSQWAMHLDEGEEVWPTPWLRNDRTPRGINLFHFRHKPLGSDFGRSCLKNVISQQNFLNKQLIDLAMVSDTQAWRQRWGVGIAADAAKQLKNQPGELWTSSNNNAKFGDFEADNPEGQLKSVVATLERMAARNKRPLHLLLTTGKLPSGESLRVAEGPLIHDATSCQPTYGEPWSGMAAMMASLEADYGDSGITYQGEVLEANWNDPATRSEGTEITNAEGKQRIGVSKQTSLEELGYDPLREAERRRDEQREADSAFNAGERGLETGGGPGPEGGGGEE